MEQEEEEEGEDEGRLFMRRYRANFPRDEASHAEGDAVFVGVNCKLSPEKLGAGL
jgi:hypothetical protein